MSGFSVIVRVRRAGHLPRGVSTSLFCHPLPKRMRALFASIWDPSVTLRSVNLLSAGVCADS
jgi:hypothetical protein